MVRITPINPLPHTVAVDPAVVHIPIAHGENVLAVLRGYANSRGRSLEVLSLSGGRLVNPPLVAEPCTVVEFKASLTHNTAAENAGRLRIKALVADADGRRIFFTVDEGAWFDVEAGDQVEHYFTVLSVSGWEAVYS